MKYTVDGFNWMVRWKLNERKPVLKLISFRNTEDLLNGATKEEEPVCDEMFS